MNLALCPFRIRAVFSALVEQAADRLDLAPRPIAACSASTSDSKPRRYSMPSSIHVVVSHSTLAEDATILTAYTTFVAAVKSATGKHVDAGGTVIGLKSYAADEATPHGRVPGDVW
jgi:hypothetical protein